MHCILYNINMNMAIVDFNLKSYVEIYMSFIMFAFAVWYEMMLYAMFAVFLNSQAIRAITCVSSVSHSLRVWNVWWCYGGAPVDMARQSTK